MQDIAIKVNQVYKTYGHLIAVKDLSFEVKTSECFGLLGPNGAGKTTMMKMLYGKSFRDQHNESEISVYGFDPQKEELNIKYISGIIPQDNNLDEELSVSQNLLIYAKFYGIKKTVALKRIEELLHFMELSDKKDSKIRELSGGLKRRLVFARALINDPKFLILDEPTTGLDPQVRHIIWDKIRLLKAQGVTVLITTHYMDEAFQLCDRLMIMHQGENVLEGNPNELVKQHIESYVLELLHLDSLNKITISDGVRKEIGDNRAFLYSNNSKNLEQLTKNLQPGYYFLRQSNLEDLFLKITGRGLKD